MVLVYVYPLKLLMDMTFYAIAPGWFPTEFQVVGVSDVAGLVVIFGVGFAVITLIQWGLYQRASLQADTLLLSPGERLHVREERLIWMVLSTAGILAAAFAWFFRSSWGYLGGIVFGLIPAVVPLVTLSTRRAIQALDEEASPSTGA